MNIVPIIVIYNKSLDDSSTLMFIKEACIFKDVVVYDNSTTENNNDQIAKQNGWHYLTNHKNDGISVAYNNCIEYICKKQMDCSYVLMLDDDAEISVAFINKSLEIIEKGNSDIYIPIIRCNVSIMSPSIIEPYGRVKKVKDISEINTSNVTAINNCMFIKLNTAKQIGYNEKLFLDYVDHDFVRRVKAKGAKIKILNLEISHNTSIDDKSISKESRMHRFLIYKKDLKEFYKSTFWGRCFYRLHILKMAIRYTVEYKSFHFMKP